MSHLKKDKNFPDFNLDWFRTSLLRKGRKKPYHNWIPQ